VLLAVTMLADTEPVHEIIRAQTPAARSPALRVVWDAGQCVVRCGDRDVGLTGAAARMLGLLAGRAGEVVHHWDLQQELQTPHLAPLATAVRHALAAAVEAGALSESRLREQLVRSGAEAPDAEDVHALMRRVVQSRRGHGYVLHLLPDDVQTEQV
jgi:hypothetical protein